MKKIILVLLFIFSNSVFSQNYESDWNEVIKHELDGETTSANNQVLEIYTKAKKSNNKVQVTKCFFYLSKFKQVLNKNAQQEIIKDIIAEIDQSSADGKAFLNYVYAKLLSDYYENDRYIISERKEILNHKLDNFLVWSKANFESEIKTALGKSLENPKLLREINLIQYREVFKVTNEKNFDNKNLYDFLLEKNLEYYVSKVRYWNVKNNNHTDISAIVSSKFETFKTINLEVFDDLNLKKILSLYLENETYYNSINSPKAAILYYDRLRKLKPLISDGIYYRKIKLLEDETKDEYLKQNLKVERVRNYVSKSNKYLKTNFYPQALQLIDSITKNNINENAKINAENIKKNILEKEISLNAENVVYPNQNNKAYVTFRNIDSIKISYYRIPSDWDEKLNSKSSKNAETIIQDYISKNKLIVSFVQKLPNSGDHFSHSAELLLRPLEMGTYLMYVEVVDNQSIKNQLFSYQKITSTNLSVLTFNDKKEDNLYVFDRKTGKPIDDVIITDGNDIAETNALGKASLREKKYDSKNNVYQNSIYLIKDNDTLITRNNRKYLNDDYESNEQFEAKAMVFFDREIYRPGQKMFYKGIIIQNRNEVKNTVPFLTTHVKIYNANYDVIKELDVQTNEFGSFSGEFEIPKNVLTGEFTFEIEEGQNLTADTKYYDVEKKKHQFWENVNADFREYSFQVEEYKRPTFEIEFDKIKENYTLGDSVIISGNAKALTGSNLTGAKVNYSILKYVTLKNGSAENEKQLTGEVFTDEKGNFKIVDIAKCDSIQNDSIDIINYTVEVDITDINGETRSAMNFVHVGSKTLALKLNHQNLMYRENENFLTIKATTLNDFPIDAKGEIKIYRIEEKSALKKALYGVPEINIISRKEHEKLFPYEPYYEENSNPIPILIKTISFDTKSTSQVNLSFLKSFKLGSYSITANAIDSKGNEITDTTNFYLNSRKNPNLEHKLFICKDITNNDSDYYEIEIRSSIKDLTIYTRLYEGNNFKIERNVELKNGIAKFKFKKDKNNKTDVYFQFATTWENNKFLETVTKEKQETAQNLTIEAITLRNKIEPGSTENWSFKILDTKLEAEILATMYDSSLDQFIKYPNSWKALYFRNYYNINEFRERYETNLTQLYFYYSARKTNAFIYKYSKEIEIDWFGFTFSGNNDYANTQYLKSIRARLCFNANEKEITGVISDSKGVIPYTNIMVKGREISAQADIDGKFSITAKRGDILVISSVGYNSKEVLIFDSDRIDIKLEDSDISLEEVVINVLGVKRLPKELAYAAKEVKTEELSQAAPINAVKALAGNVSGLNILTKNNDVNPSKGIVLRGYKSLTGNNQALIIVDGVIISNSDLNSLNPDDIVSITNLNSTNATVLYGSEGANGALIVTTKKMIQEVADVKTRRNFNETAFFYPDLKTDTDGKISFSFTTPESLTKWKLRLHAINKKAETGYLESFIISQKDVMIMPNMPRFVREKDTITISAKVVNMTDKAQSGTALLLLFDATTLKPIDSISLNSVNSKNFICKPKESVAVNWTITIPDNLQGLQYKILAKSGNFTDGEENIIPVLTNKVLITESLPIWVRENSTKEVVFENLKNNQSPTLKNHLFTLEYTSNPVWFAIKSLPYLMEYEHECAEQTFARYYANCIATEIISSNPKIASLFESWKKDGKTKSKMEMNSELKSIILAETPWFLDADEEAKNKQLALLFDLNSLKESTEKTYQKLQQKMLPSGGFPWFDGGNENLYITQHILSGIGHLSKLFPKTEANFKTIIEKGIPNSDAKFLESNKLNSKITNYNYINLQYLYTRSFYLEKFPLSNNLKTTISKQLQELKKNWLTYSLYQKAMMALIMKRYNENDFAKKIITHLKQTAVQNTDEGMFWLENKNGYKWYQSSIETQALLIEAFSEIENNKKTIDEMKVWLIKNKQTNNWPTTKATTEAIYALMLTGSDWKSIKDNTVFKVGNEKILTEKLAEKDKEIASGYVKLSWNANEITRETATISVNNKSEVVGYGGVYWQYFEELQNVKEAESKELSITKELYKKIKTADGEKLVSLDNEKLKVGDLITVRLVINATTDLEFVHLKDLRASCFEPVNVISEYRWKELHYYMSTKDVATHFFFDAIKSGTYTIEYDVRINNSGSFNNGIATLQSMYAPEFTAHSVSDKVKVVTD